MGARAGYLPFPKGFQTVCLHHGQDPHQWASKSVVPPIVTSTIFQIDNPEKPEQFTYSRMQNPTRYILENVLAKINSGKAGFCFSSGMSAITAVLGLLKNGDHVVACDEMNGESFNVFSTIAKGFGIDTTFANFTNIPEICSAIKDNTKLFWVENPTDPTMRITDLCAVAEIAKYKKILLGVDNTYLTPFLQRPLELGADLVCQSLTKYINGHSDTIMGGICLREEKLIPQMYTTQIILGLTPAPFDCYQVLRGMRTLHLRMESHHEKAMVIAHYLEQHPAIEKVLHPGLPSHPQHELFKKQASGHSGVLSFYIKGSPEDTKKFMEKLNYFAVSEVAGGNESTVSIPAIMSHKSLTAERKSQLLITENLVKLSVGLETICDLICDLDAALGAIKDSKKGKCDKK